MYVVIGYKYAVVIVREQKGGEKEKKKKKEKRDYICKVFLLFLHESRMLIFIKNNMKNIKYILTVRSNSV